MNIQILYVSSTGNTEKLAEAIYRAVPEATKDVKRLDSCCESHEADLYFIGFWANRGTASLEVLDYLSELHDKSIVLFGTCGMGNNPDYYSQIANRVAAFIPEDNLYLGHFMCQGKMPMHIRQKYENKLTVDNETQVKKLLRNFDEALLHPDQSDYHEAARFVESLFQQKPWTQH